MNIKITDNSNEVRAAMHQAALKALEECGLLAERYAKAGTPVDTGNLRNSISHTVEESEPAVYIGTNVEYAPYVELGTKRMKAHPYLKPAVADHADEYRAIIEQELKNG